MLAEIEPVTLAACPPGPFFFTGHGSGIGFKTEYGMTIDGEVTRWPEAFCAESGECFWGGASTHEDRAALLVRPLTMDQLGMFAPDQTPFRRGVRAAIQAAVHDLGELVKRRERMGVNDDRTAVIVGIARRIASLAMPVSEDQAALPMDRNVLMAKVARMILPGGDWDSVASFTSDGQFLDEAGQPVEGTDLMRTVWRIADEIVVLVRYM